MSDLKWTPVRVRLGQIKPWTENPRMSTKAQAERLIQSERELGQVQTIAIGQADADGKYPLYDGHQRYSAWYTVKGAEYELTALQSNRDLTEDERRKMSILLHTASGGWDWNKMSGWQVGELKEWGLVNSENVHGWNMDALNVREILNDEGEPIDPLQEWQNMPEFNQQDKDAIKSIIVNFYSQDDIKSFFELIGQKFTDKTRSISFPERERERLQDYIYES